MTNYDLPAALKKYRTEHGLSLSQMGKKLNMSKPAYYRLERGVRKPYHDELVTILEKLELNVDPADIPSIPKPDPKWYHSQTIHWIIPVLIAVAGQSLLLELPSFRATFGEEAIAAGKHLRVMVIFGAVFCAIYWYFLPPEIPKRKPTRSEVMYIASGIAVFLLLYFFEELVMPGLRWMGFFLDNTPAGLWIALTFITALLGLFIWGFRKVIMVNIKNPFTTDKLFQTLKNTYDKQRRNT